MCYRFQKFSWTLKAIRQNQTLLNTIPPILAQKVGVTNCWEQEEHSEKYHLLCICFYTFPLDIYCSHDTRSGALMFGLFLYNVILSSRKYQKFPVVIVIASPGFSFVCETHTDCEKQTNKNQNLFRLESLVAEECKP